MRSLLDTCVISDFINNASSTVAKKTSPVGIAVSSITAMELLYGLLLHPQRGKEIEPVINSFWEAIAVLLFGIEEGDRTARIRAIS